MIYLKTDQLYYNVRKHFRLHIMDQLANNDTAWYNGFRQWLAEQGCVITNPEHYENIVMDPLGVAAGYHFFAFKKEEDATVFVLRWS